MSLVALYHENKSPRGKSVITALAQGIAQSGMDDKVKVYTEDEYQGPTNADFVAFYGLGGNLMQLAQDHWQSDIPTIFFDLPYWGRKHEPYPQCHRFAINAYQPTSYFRVNHTPERFEVFERMLQPWQTDGEEVLVIGMSEKQTQVWGLGESLAFHASLIKRLREYTDRPIAWRPKPSCCLSGSPIPSTRFAVGDLADQLRRAYCVVTYRSNVAIDGLLAGVPCVVLGDHPAEIMARQSLDDIERPFYPDDRLGFCADLAWCQVTMQELRNGWAWKLIREQIGELREAA